MVSSGKQKDDGGVAIFTNTSYNNFGAEVAQLVEQRTENPRVPSSILGLGTKLETRVTQE